jgi:two-component system chemotaxis sensor kinase CheA
VKFGERLVGIGVDALIELQEIVVRSLGRYIGNVKGVAGASILGDGKIVLILDISTLMGLALQVSGSIRPEKRAART